MPSTNPQVNSALVIANARRRGLAELKREVRGGMPIADALRDPRVTKYVTVQQLLRWQRGRDQTAARTVCRRAGVPLDTRVFDLSEYQIDRTAEETAKSYVRGIACRDR